MAIRLHFRTTFFCVLAGLSALVAHAQPVQTWLMLYPKSQETFFSTDPTEQTTLTKTGWKVVGTGSLQATAQPGTVAVHRLVKTMAQGGDRIFSISPEQTAAAVKLGYVNEGALGQVAPTQLTPDLIPVYHFTKDSRNLWLIDKSEPWVEKSGWVSKGVAFWLWPVSSP